MRSLAAIPYTTFPTIDLGFVELRTFGLVVALGVLLGAWLAARYGEEHGIPRDTTYSLAMRMVVAGVIGSRITWVASHLEDLDSPFEAFAIWKGGLQFSGGFVFAVAYLLWWLRRNQDVARLPLADGFAYGLCAGLIFGRIGCYSVGEHFGRRSDFFLASEFRGGDTVEPATVGESFHNTAMYEGLGLIVLLVVLTVLRRRDPRPGTLLAVFCLWYGLQRFLTDTLRAFDDRTLGLTGAQMLMVVVFGFGLLLVARLRGQGTGPQVSGPEPLAA